MSNTFKILKHYKWQRCHIVRVSMCHVDLWVTILVTIFLTFGKYELLGRSLRFKIYLCLHLEVFKIIFLFILWEFHTDIRCIVIICSFHFFLDLLYLLPTPTDFQLYSFLFYYFILFNLYIVSLCIPDSNSQRSTCLPMVGLKVYKISLLDFLRTCTLNSFT